MIQIDCKMFFDRATVQAKVKDGTKSSLSKFGAFVRRTAKGLIRSGKKSAKPGNPPKSHTGKLRDLIFFGYDTTTESVVIGPKLFRAQKPTGPHLLEFGGTTTNWRTGKPAVYRQFPFMQPALEKEAPKFPSMFDGMLKG